MLVVQFGTDHPDVSAALKPTVSQLATDHTVAVQERAKVGGGVQYGLSVKPSQEKNHSLLNFRHPRCLRIAVVCEISGFSS